MFYIDTLMFNVNFLTLISKHLLLNTKYLLQITKHLTLKT